MEDKALFSSSKYPINIFPISQQNEIIMLWVLINNYIFGAASNDSHILWKNKQNTSTFCWKKSVLIAATMSVYKT